MKNRNKRTLPFTMALASMQANVISEKEFIFHKVMRDLRGLCLDTAAVSGVVCSHTGTMVLPSVFSTGKLSQ